MRLLGSLLPLFTFGTLASAAASAVNKFDKFASLASSAPTPGLVELNSRSYDELVSAPRNYTAVVLLTAKDAKFKCTMCKVFQPEYELLAQSWQKKGKTDGLFITSLDFEKGKDTFMKVCYSGVYEEKMLTRE